MKKHHVLTPILLAGAMTLAPVPAYAAEPSERLASAEEVLNDAASFHVDFDLNTLVAVSTGEDGTQAEQLSLALTGNITYFADPLKLKAELNADLGQLGAQDIVIYMEQAGDEILTYTQMPDASGEGEWSKTSMSLSSYNDLKESNSQFDQWIASSEDLGEEMVNDTATTKLQATISGASIGEVIANSGALDSLDSLGLPIDISGLLTNMDDFTMTYWLTEDNFLVKSEVDLSGFFQRLIDEFIPIVQELAALSGSEMPEYTISLDHLTFTTDLSAYNAAEDFQIPEEALNAIDATQQALDALDTQNGEIQDTTVEISEETTEE